MSPLEREVAQLIIDELRLEDVTPEEIDPKAPLFVDGLGLDSIDALELSLALSQKYGVQIRGGDSENEWIFASLSNLTRHIEIKRTG